MKGKKKNKGVEVEFHAGMDITRAFIELHKAAAKHVCDAYGKFNNHILTSNMTLDEMYIEITGKDYKTHEKEEKRELKRLEEEEKKAKAEAPKKAEDFTNKMIERGYIQEKDRDKFLKLANVRCADLYHGWELNAMLEIIDILVKNKDNKDKAIKLAEKKFYKQGHSGMSAGLTGLLIKTYSPVFGEDFHKKVICA